MYMKKTFLEKQLFALVLIVVITIIFFTTFYSSASSQAKTIVEKFYSYEQEGNFSDSWQLFHPFMKDKFPKAAFIQDRAHVFIGHFGDESFEYEVGKVTELENWSAAKEQSPFKIAYKVEVTQFYQGKYGKFSFIQEVYVVKHKKDWTILWNYNK